MVIKSHFEIGYLLAAFAMPGVILIGSLLSVAHGSMASAINRRDDWCIAWLRADRRGPAPHLVRGAHCDPGATDAFI